MGVLIDGIPSQHAWRSCRRLAAIQRKDSTIVSLRLRLAHAEDELRRWNEWWASKSGYMWESWLPHIGSSSAEPISNEDDAKTCVDVVPASTGPVGGTHQSSNFLRSMRMVTSQLELVLSALIPPREGSADDAANKDENEAALPIYSGEDDAKEDEKEAEFPIDAALPCCFLPPEFHDWEDYLYNGFFDLELEEQRGDVGGVGTQGCGCFW